MNRHQSKNHIENVNSTETLPTYGTSVILSETLQYASTVHGFVK